MNKTNVFGAVQNSASSSSRISNFTKRLAVLTLLLLTVVLGTKAADYVISYTNGGTTYYLGMNGNELQAKTTFDITCVWTSETNLGNTSTSLRNRNNSSYYLTTSCTRQWNIYNYTYTWSSLSVQTTASNIWRSSNATNGNVYARISSAGNRQASINVQSLTMIDNNTNSSKNGLVTITQVSTTSTNPTINGNAVLTATGNYTYTASGAAYQAGGYVNYIFNDANHYFDNNTAIIPKVATLNGTAWSISANEYATINSSGVVTVNSIPTSDVTLTITATVSVTGGTPTAPAGTTLVGTKEITIQGSVPAAPTISVSGTIVTLQTDATGTTSIRYTIDGTDPTATTGTVYNGAFDISGSTNSPVTIKAITVRNGNASSVTTQQVKLTLPEPVITVNAAKGTAIITCSNSSATIYYTTDGSAPSATNGTSYNGQITGLATMATVKTIAVCDGWNSSSVASATVTIPSGVSGGTVTLFDYEDHKWSYYSDEECPIHSLNPADVKITYYGNGTKTVTNASAAEAVENPTSFSLDATTVKVGPNDDANVFVYYKTLERENVDGTGNVPYTTIPNPFLVRPTGDGGTSAQTPTSVTVYLEWNCNTWERNGTTAKVTYSYTDVDGNTQSGSSDGKNGNATITAKIGTTITLTASGSRDPSTNNTRPDNQSTITARLNDASGTQIATITSQGTAQRSITTSPLTASQQSVTFNYRGFYAWRVKSKSEGLSITDVNGNSFANNIIPAEAEIRFVTSNEYGNEVEFEALWAQAYVTDGTSDLSTRSNSYERNFHVVKSATSASSFQKNYPLTVTSRYPDGTSAGGSVTGGFTAAADTKFENITISNATNATWTANGHDLIVGRGCSGTIEVVRGMNGGSSNAVAYTIRLESGTFSNFYLISSSSATYSNTISAKATFGCDYDRAGNNNSQLSIAPSSGNIYGGQSMQISSSANRNNLTFDWIVKSGTFHQGILGNASGGDKSIYLGSSQASGGNLQYIGKRRITIEGGNMAGIAGGMNNVSTAYGVNDGSWAVMMRIKGGDIRSSVYGAAAFAQAVGDRVMILTGGTINGWVAGGCNGTQTGSGGTLNGDTKIYVGGVSQVVHSNTDPTISTSKGGNVFGAGSGYSADYDIGEVNNSTLVLADNAVISRGLYGGGNYGYVGEGYQTYIHILGGKVANVFGGANQRFGQSVNIVMENGVVTDGIYGGSNVSGTINNNVTLQINGGQVGTSSKSANIHGGGYGQATRVSGNVEVTLGTAKQATGGVTVYGDVYGGSALGTVNTNTSNTTVVNLTGGIIHGDAYGGGLGDSDTKADVNGNVTVTLDGTAFVLATTTDDKGNTIPTSGRVFGCNNINGSPKGTVLVQVLSTVAKNGDGTIKDKPTTKNSGIYELQAVYGGGNLAAYYPTNPKATGQYTYTFNSETYGEVKFTAEEKPVQVVIDGCDLTSIEYVYGGGNAAPTPATDALVLGSYEIGNVFGGGNGKDRYTLDGGNTWNENQGADVGIIDAVAYQQNTANGTYGTGKSKASVLGGTVHNLFGASNTKGNVVTESLAYVDNANLCDLNVGGIYGGGNEAYMDGDSKIELGCIEALEEIYGGARNADVKGDINLTISSGHFDRVFGGNNIGGTINGSITVTIKETGCNPITIGELYGCGNQAPYTTPEGEDDPIINLISFTSIGNVFGGGFGENAVVKGNPTVNIDVKEGDNRERDWAYNGQTITFSDGSKVTLPVHEKGKIGVIGTVYGGGNAAAVIGNTTVKMTKGIVENTLFGGGNAANVEGSTSVTILDGTIGGNVYGGGNQGNVTGATKVQIGQQPTP